MSKLMLWIMFILSAVVYQSVKQLVWGAGDVSDAVNSIYWTGFGILSVHLFT